MKSENLKSNEEKIEEKKDNQEEKETKNDSPEKELPFRPINNSKLDIVPYLDKDIYMLYEPNYKKHEVNYSVININ